jgi:hypothetical protein
MANSHIFFLTAGEGDFIIKPVIAIIISEMPKASE